MCWVQKQSLTSSVGRLNIWEGLLTELQLKYCSENKKVVRQENGKATLNVKHL